MSERTPFEVIGITAAEFAALPRAVRSYANRMHTQTQRQTTPDAVRATEVMIQATHPEQIDRMQALVYNRINAILKHCEESTDNVEVRLHTLAQLALAQGVFDALRSGRLPAAYAHRAVWSLADSPRGRGDGAAATQDDPTPWTFGA